MGICDKFSLILKKVSISQAEISDDLFFKSSTPKLSFTQAKFAIYSYSWANYSISLQKSPLSNTRTAHDNEITRKNNISGPPRPQPKIWGWRPQTPGLKSMVLIVFVSLLLLSVQILTNLKHMLTIMYSV